MTDSHSPHRPGRTPLRPILLVAGLLAGLCPAYAFASEPWLVKDIMPGNAPSGPTELLAVDGLLYFRAQDPDEGEELWETDGTELGTRLIVIREGPQSSRPIELARVQDVLYFVADDGTAGRELWQHADPGLNGGTVRRSDIQPGAPGSGVDWLTGAEKRLYFTADDATTGSNIELWAATIAGVYQVAELEAETPDEYDDDGSHPQWLRAFGDSVYFTAGGDAGYGIYCSDGSATGTVLVSDPDVLGGAHSLVNMGGTLFFQGNGAGTGEELWRQGAGGVYLVEDIAPGSGSSWANDLAYIPGDLAPGTVYFSAVGPAGNELWRHGVAGGDTQALTDSFPNNGGPADLTAVGDTLFFHASDGEHGIELWKYTPAGGAEMVKDIRVGKNSSFPFYLKAIQLSDAPGDAVLVFAADDGVHGKEVWVSDGTAEGTRLAADVMPGGNGSIRDGSHYRYFEQVGDTLFFKAWSYWHGDELWALDVSAFGAPGGGDPPPDPPAPPAADPVPAEDPAATDEDPNPGDPEAPATGCAGAPPASIVWSILALLWALFTGRRRS